MLPVVVEGDLKCAHIKCLFCSVNIDSMTARLVTKTWVHFAPVHNDVIVDSSKTSRVGESSHGLAETIAQFPGWNNDAAPVARSV